MKKRTATPGTAAPSQPPLTAEEIAHNADIRRRLLDLIPILRQNNLDAAVGLAIQAARGEGPLVDHFAELGRRFADELTKPQKPARKTNLRVIEGGAGE